MARKWTQAESARPDVEVIRGHLIPEITKTLFDHLEKEVEWHEAALKDGTVVVPLKRRMAYYADEAAPYQYHRYTIPGASWREETTLNQNLRAMRDGVAFVLNEEFNSVLLNYYPDGSSEINWHADKEPQLGEEPVIACVNLGASRKMHFKPIEGDKTGSLTNITVRSIDLHAGDLLVMNKNCQKKWLHAILKEPFVTKPRISLTFRKVIPVGV